MYHLVKGQNILHFKSEIMCSSMVMKFYNFQNKNSLTCLKQLTGAPDAMVLRRYSPQSNERGDPENNTNSSIKSIVTASVNAYPILRSTLRLLG